MAFYCLCIGFSDCHGKRIDLALIQYYFTGKEHSIYKPPHGNSKSSTPYKRTLPSTMNRMKTLASKNGPVAMMKIIDEEVGDVIGQHSAGSRLRNVQQVSNARRHLNMEKGHGGKGNHLIEAMEMCKSGMNEKILSCVVFKLHLNQCVCWLRIVS